MPEIVVYLGPTLPLETACRYLSATYLPPVRRGDIERLPQGTRTVGIIDGEFHQNLAVSPKEIVALLDRGVQVYGASSIGALRAAETHRYGMTGVGSIFAMYRDGEIDADDEVAIAYDPATNRATSEPLVNIRFALRDAVAQEIIARAEAEEIIDSLKSMYYPARSYRLVGEMCPALAPFLNATHSDQKRDDAVLMLLTIASRLQEQFQINA
jgi:TfuA protein